MKSKTGSTMSKLRQKPLTIRVYPLLAREIEERCESGLRRAYKYAPDSGPSPEAVRDAIEESVMTGLCEFFDFGDPS